MLTFVGTGAPQVSGQDFAGRLAVAVLAVITGAVLAVRAADEAP